MGATCLPIYTNAFKFLCVCEECENQNQVLLLDIKKKKSTYNALKVKYTKK